MGAKNSLNIASFQNTEFCHNYTIESTNPDVMQPIQEHDADYDQMPPLEPIQDNDADDDHMPPLESIYNRYLHFANQNESRSSPTVFTNDTIVNTVIQSFISRSNLGFKKYNNTLDRNDLSTFDWVIHTQEELMDAILYLERLKKNL